jgi:hypothetical protein
MESSIIPNLVYWYSLYVMGSYGRRNTQWSGMSLQ